MGLIVVEKRTWRIMCDLNLGCGRARAPETVAWEEAAEAAREAGYRRDTETGLWACVNCREQWEEGDAQ